uniref:Uncharacterized protein n=1 Tax=Phytophthora ramorum TaxID=164328 RepID=H3GSE7_PHYRM
MQWLRLVTWFGGTLDFLKVSEHISRFLLLEHDYRHVGPDDQRKDQMGLSDPRSMWLRCRWPCGFASTWQRQLILEFACNFGRGLDSIMKTSTLATTCVLAASALAVVSVTARPMHPNINYERYLAQRDEGDAEAKLWKGNYYAICAENNWLPDHSEERGIYDEDEDIRQRLFMSKQDVLEAQAANPNANFSIMTPFSVLTKEEFASKVLNSYIQVNTTKTPTPATAAPATTTQKRSLRQQDAYTFTSMQDMINSLMKSLQAQTGGSWSIGTVKPSTDTTDNNANHGGTNEQWHWTQPNTAAPIP